MSQVFIVASGRGQKCLLVDSFISSCYVFVDLRIVQCIIELDLSSLHCVSNSSRRTRVSSTHRMCLRKTMQSYSADAAILEIVQFHSSARVDAIHRVHFPRVTGI